jgi:hypothetical protein
MLIDINEQKPKNEERVLIYDKYQKEVYIAKWFGNDNSFWSDEVGSGFRYSGSHWQKLPNNPIGQT